MSSEGETEVLWGWERGDVTRVPRPVVQTVVVMRFRRLKGTARCQDDGWMDLDLDLDLALGGTGPGGLGRWTLGLAGTEREMWWVLPATPRFLFPRKAGRRGYLG